MKSRVIDLEILAEDIRAWGVPATIHYDDSEEGYVLHAGEITHGPNMGQAEVTIAPGFKHLNSDGLERIIAYIDNIHVNTTENIPVNSSLRSRIVAQSRLGYHQLQKQTLIIT